jgi:hypothetical protein
LSSGASKYGSGALLVLVLGIEDLMVEVLAELAGS